MTNSDMFWRFENDYLDLQFFHFCVAQNIKYLKLIFCKFVGYIIEYVRIFFPEFFDTQKYDFLFFFLKEITGAHVHQISVPSDLELLLFLFVRFLFDLQSF
jgi:hypothetical protein